MKGRRFRAVVVGCSAGGLDALRRLLGPLPAGFPLSIVVVAHMAPDGDSMLAGLLDDSCKLDVREAEEKMKAEAGRVYVCPAGYHLLMEADETFSLSVDDKVCNVRPSIDVLFESAADVWSDGLIGVVLTGANSDGTAGLRAIKAAGGYGIVQDPSKAFADVMPRSAVNAGLADRILAVEDMPAQLVRLARQPSKGAGR